ncbi:hypothetical protein [Mycolicibacterium sp. HS_4_1]
MTVQLTGVCRHCTVRIEAGETCDFCRRYTPTTTLLDTAVKVANQARQDVSDAIAALPTDAPLWSRVDLVAALGYLRLASVKITKAAERINESVTQ